MLLHNFFTLNNKYFIFHHDEYIIVTIKYLTSIYYLPESFYNILHIW